jgi:CRP-like cAMP-binding protein
MSLETDIQLLGLVPMLTDFSEEKLRLLAFSSENRTFRNGQRLFSAGERADSAYVVSEGHVVLYSPDTPDTAKATLGPGAMLGDLALIVETERTETAVAVGDVVAIQIRRPLFRRMLDEYPEIARALHGRIAGGLSGTMAELNALRDRLERLE